MTSNELRFGNLVYVDWKDAGKKVQTNYGVFNLPKGGMSGWSDVDGWRMNTVSNGYAVHLEIVSGIPLTEDWLLKFGFEKNITAYYVEWKFINDIFYSYVVDGEFRWFSKVIPNIDKIRHVHQLQNLYFALTGEELTQTT